MRAETDQQKRIAIALECGWTFVARCGTEMNWTPELELHARKTFAELRGMKGPWKEQVTPCGCDGQWDYYSDSYHRLRLPPLTLDEVHEAEKCLSEKQKRHYAIELMKDKSVWSSTYEDVFQIMHSTIHQRAEALLRVLGKWNL